MHKIVQRLKNSINIEKIKTYFKDHQPSSENLNAFMRKKQNLWGFVVLLSLLLIFFVLHELAKNKTHKALASIAAIDKESVPDGVLSSDFSEKNSLSALETQQQQIDQLNKSVEKLSQDKDSEISESNKNNLAP